MTGNMNQLDIYDMSGNVWDWCFTESGSARVRRGGSWGSNADILRVGYVDDFNPDGEINALGFRFSRTP